MTISIPISILPIAYDIIVGVLFIFFILSLISETFYEGGRYHIALNLFVVLIFVSVIGDAILAAYTHNISIYNPCNFPILINHYIHPIKWIVDTFKDIPNILSEIKLV